MKLNKFQKASLCCFVSQGLRMKDPTEEKILDAMAPGLSSEMATERNRLARMKLDELDPLFEKALSDLQRNHLGLTDAEMLQAKAKGKIIYKPALSHDKKFAKASDGTVYVVGKNGNFSRAVPKIKESKKERRMRRRGASGKQSEVRQEAR